MSAVDSARRQLFREASSRWFWRPEFIAVKCSNCGLSLYCTNGRSVRVTLGSPHPVTISIGNLCACFCGRACALGWIARLPEDELRSGGRRMW